MPIYDKYTKTLYHNGTLDDETLTKLPKVKLSHTGRFHIYHKGASVFSSYNQEEILTHLKEFYTLVDYTYLPIPLSEPTPSYFVLEGKEFSLRTWAVNEFMVNYLQPYFYAVTVDTLYQRIAEAFRKGNLFEDALKEPLTFCELLFPKGVVLDGLFYLSLTQVARAKGIKPVTLHARVDTGMSLEEALSKPLRPIIPVSARQVTYKGVTYSSHKELAKAYDVSYSSLLARLRRGLSLEEALDKSQPRRDCSSTPKLIFGEHTFYTRNDLQNLIFLVDGVRVKFSKLDELIGIDNLLAHPDLDDKVRTYLENRFHWVSSEGNTFYSLKQVADYYNLDYAKLRYAVQKGTSLEQIIS